jgi:hypothetical protein
MKRFNITWEDKAQKYINRNGSQRTLKAEIDVIMPGYITHRGLMSLPNSEEVNAMVNENIETKEFNGVLEKKLL